MDSKEGAWESEGDSIAAQHETGKARIKATCAPDHQTGKWIPDITAASPDFLTQFERDGLSAEADEIEEIRQEETDEEQWIIIIKGMPLNSLGEAAEAAQTQAEALSHVLLGKEQARAKNEENKHLMNLEKDRFLAGSGSPKAGARFRRIPSLLPDLRTSSWLAIAAGIALCALTWRTTEAWIGFWFVITIVTAQLLSITEAGRPRWRRRRKRR